LPDLILTALIRRKIAYYDCSVHGALISRAPTRLWLHKNLAKLSTHRFPRRRHHHTISILP
jgi:hypothetical protein